MKCKEMCFGRANVIKNKLCENKCYFYNLWIELKVLALQQRFLFTSFTAD